MRTLSCLFVLAVLAVPARAEEKVNVDKAVELAKVMEKAVLAGEHAKVVELTHPKVVEAMGGKDKMIEAIDRIMNGMKAQGIAIKSHTVGKPEEPVVDGKSAYVVLPTKLEMTAPQARIAVESYLLGFSTDHGKSWVFVDGAGLNQGPAKDLILPLLPKNLKLPAPKPPVVTKD
jgi:hypothetical protein